MVEYSPTTPGRRSKIKRIVDKYKLNGLPQELERKWTADEPDRSSLRKLAEYVNHQLLKSAIRDAEISVIDAEINTYYQVLTDDRFSGADRTRLERRLEREGVPVDELKADFVTRQAVHTFLTKYMNVKYEPDRKQDTSFRDSIERLRGRLASVVETTLESLQQKDERLIGSPRVIVNVHVICEDCGYRSTVDEILEQEGCDCKGGRML